MDVDGYIELFTYFYIFTSIVLLPVVRYFWSRKQLGYLFPVVMIALGALLVTCLELPTPGGEADAGKQVLSSIVANTSLIIWSAALGVLVLRTAPTDSSGESEPDTDTDGSADPAPVAASGRDNAVGQTTFCQLLGKFRAARPASSKAFGRWKRLSPLFILLLAVVVLIVLPAEWREPGWVRATALVTVLACYLYGLWLLVLPLRTLLDPVPELMRELDRRYEQESALRDFLHSMPEQQRRLMTARLERYVRRLSGASKISQLAFVLSPLLAFLLELVSQGGLSSLERGPLLIGGMLLAVVLGVLIGIMQLRRALVELESLQFSLGEQPADPVSLRYG